MRYFAFLFLLLPGMAFAHEAVRVRDAWTPPSMNQSNGVGFLTLHTAGEDALVGVESDCCAIVELHEMTMNNDVMRMRRVKSIPLPAHKNVALKSGGYHLMLIGLKKPVEVGDEVPVTLRFKHAEPVNISLKARERDSAATHSHEHH